MCVCSYIYFLVLFPERIQKQWGHLEPRSQFLNITFQKDDPLILDEEFQGEDKEETDLPKTSCGGKMSGGKMSLKNGGDMPKGQKN